MRPFTAVVVAAVALMGLLAIADALRSNEPEARPATEGTTTRDREPSSLREMLSDELVLGFVVYSDERCGLHSLLLPQLVDQGISEDAEPRCRFDSTDGWILEEGEVLSPNWRFIARCSDGEIVVREAETGIVRRRLEGCAPAWRPEIGNRLTWARGEAVYERGRPLLTRGDLRALARRHPNIDDVRAPFRVHVRDLVWMEAEHLLVSLEMRSPHFPREYITVVLEGGETVVGQATSFQGPVDTWFATSSGSLAAAADGTILSSDQLSIARAVAFSPDERWLAYVSGRSVYLIGTPRNNEPGRIIRLPVPAQDLAWERTTTNLTFPPPTR
jgi:hypothetical protein